MKPAKASLTFVSLFALLLVFYNQALGQSAAPQSQATAGPSPTATPAAAPPSTDIFLVNVARKAGQLSFGQPINLTRREGYDNQPSFAPDGRSLLYTSIRQDAQADIYRYDLRTGATSRVTETREDEYSPTVMPGGNFMSVVRVEADKTQRLWKFPLSRTGIAAGAPSLVLEAVKPVGYHAWVNDNTLALFVLGTPNTLQLADARTGRAETIIGDVGRSLHRVPRRPRVFSFVHKVAAGEWLIKTFDTKTRRIVTLAPTMKGSEDYVWAPDGQTLLMAQGTKLFALNVGAAATGWTEVADFSAAGLRDITRLDLSPKGDNLALVARQ